MAHDRMALVQFGHIEYPPIAEDIIGRLWFIVAILVGLLLLSHGIMLRRRLQLIRNTPTESVQSVAVGRTELRGEVQEPQEPIEPPYRDEACVYVSWWVDRIEEGSGLESDSWDWVADGMERTEFRLDDGTGRIPIRAEEATFDVENDGHVDKRTIAADERPPPELLDFVEEFGGTLSEIDPEKVGFDEDVEPEDVGLDNGVSGAELRSQLTEEHSGEIRYEQRVLPVGAEVYVFGAAKRRDDTSDWSSQEDKLEIRSDESIGVTGGFLVADGHGTELEERYTGRWLAEIAAGLLLTIFGLAGLLS